MLRRKVWRDLRQNLTQFMAIFLMSLLGMWIYGGMDAESTGASKVAAHFYQEYNLSDLWIMGGGFSSEEVKNVSEIPGVISAERRLMVTGELDLASDSEAIQTKEVENPSMQMGFLTDYQTNRFEVMEGEDFTPEKEGVWIDRFVVAKHHLKIGDTVRFKVNNVTVTSILKGVIRTPEMVYYADSTDITAEYGDHGYAFMAAASYPSAESMIYNQIVIDTLIDAVEEQDTMREAIALVLDRENIVVSDRSQTLAYNTFQSEMAQHKSMGVIFSGVFLLIAVLGIITTMTRLTSNQRIQIGTLKALGFSKKVITRHYVSYGFLLSLLGSITGMYTGAMTLPRIIYPAFEGGYELPALKGQLSMGPYMAVLISVTVSSIVSFLSCRKELSDPPAVTLKPAAPKKIKHSTFEKSKMWLSMSFSSQWNVRDILRNKARSVMGIIGVSGCTMLMVCAYGCSDSIYALVDWMYGGLLTSEYKITLSEEADYGTAVDYANQYMGQLLQESPLEIFAGDVRKTGALTVLDTGNYMHYQDTSLNKVSLNETGVALSYKMAQGLGISKGDFIKWHIVGDDEWETTRVVQVYRDPMTPGITMTRKVFEDLDHSFAPTAILTNVKVADNLTDDENVMAVLNVAQMKADFRKNMEGMNMMITMMVTSAIILGIVVLYNLGVLSFVEKMREIATLKVLGFQTGKIRGILQAQNIWITAMGVLAGLPFGYGLLIAMCQTMSADMDLVPVVGMKSYLISIGGTFLVSIVVNFLLSGKVKTIDMVDALKSAE